MRNGYPVPKSASLRDTCTRRPGKKKMETGEGNRETGRQEDKVIRANTCKTRDKKNRRRRQSIRRVF